MMFHQLIKISTGNLPTKTLVSIKSMIDTKHIFIPNIGLTFFLYFIQVHRYHSCFDSYYHTIITFFQKKKNVFYKPNI